MDEPIVSKSPLSELSKARYSGNTIVQERAASVGTARVEILPNNPNRLSWDIINTSLIDIRVSSNPNLTMTTGFLLAPSGGVMGMDFQEDGDGAGYGIYAIASAAGASIWIREVTRS